MAGLITKYKRHQHLVGVAWQLFLESKTKEQQQKLKYIRKIDFDKKLIKTLSNKYPVFNPYNPKPLKVGILKDIQLEDVSNIKIKSAIQYYVGSATYLKALVEQEHRYNLDDSIHSLIDQESKDHAKAILSKRPIKKTTKKSVKSKS